MTRQRREGEKVRESKVLQLEPNCGKTVKKKV